MEVPKDFKGIPEDFLQSLELEKDNAKKDLRESDERKHNYAQTHEDALRRLLASYSLASQVRQTVNKIESTQLVYRLTGWVPLDDCQETIEKLRSNQNRIAIREYQPESSQVLFLVMKKFLFS